MYHDGGAGVTQLARVPAFQADCCGFEPRHPLHCEKMFENFSLGVGFFLFRKKWGKNWQIFGYWV